MIRNQCNTASCTSQTTMNNLDPTPFKLCLWAYSTGNPNAPLNRWSWGHHLLLPCSTGQRSGPGWPGSHYASSRARSPPRGQLVLWYDITCGRMLPYLVVVLYKPFCDKFKLKRFNMVTWHELWPLSFLLLPHSASGCASCCSFPVFQGARRCWSSRTWTRLRSRRWNGTRKSGRHNQRHKFWPLGGAKCKRHLGVAMEWFGGEQTMSNTTVARRCHATRGENAQAVKPPFGSIWQVATSFVGMSIWKLKCNHEQSITIIRHQVHQVLLALPRTAPLQFARIWTLHRDSALLKLRFLPEQRVLEVFLHLNVHSRSSSK